MNAGCLRKRGRVWWMRYYVGGRRIEESARTEDRSVAEALLSQRVNTRRQMASCPTCGEMPEIGPKALTLAWLRRIERRYNGRLPSTKTLEMLHEQETWARLRKAMSA